MRSFDSRDHVAIAILFENAASTNPAPDVFTVPAAVPKALKQRRSQDVPLLN